MASIYSPSQSKTWLTCPVMRLLDQEGWVPKVLARRDLAAGLGTITHAGMAAICGGDELPLDKVQESWTVLRTAWEDRLLPDHLKSQHDAILPRALRTIELLGATPIFPTNWSIVAVEQELRAHVRPDLVVNDGVSLAPVDFKVSLNLDDRAATFRRELYANSWQMNHYAWEVMHHYNTIVQHTYIAQIVVEPKPKLLLWDYPTDAEALELWADSAQRVWAQMRLEDEGKAEPWQAAEHGDQYGMCQYYRACFIHKYDANLMQADYIKRERR